MRSREALSETRSVAVPGGQSVEGRWDFPDLIEVVHKVPLVFFAPVEEMSDLDGPFTELARELNSCGFATFRFPASSGLITPQGLCELYQISLSHLRISREHSVLIGMGEGADLLARAYYDFYAVQPPFAMVLLSPTPAATPYHLNQITCPYFVIHGLRDSYFADMPYASLKEAVHHHQMRYGDSTTELLVPGLGRELGSEQALERRIVDEVINWLGHAAPRHQEVRERAG